MRFTSRVAAVFLAVLTLLPFAAYAQTTGNIIGTVTDNTGAVLPGVTVTVTGPNLQGSRTTVTGNQGEYSLTALPPGNYRLEYSLSGLSPTTRENVRVGLDTTTRADATMGMGAVAEAITVTADAVVVDPTQTTVQQNFGTNHLKYATIGAANRSYQSVLQQAPGVAGGANPQVMGANLGQNNYTLDGVNTTDPVTHTFGSNLPFDAIQEISIQTLGKDAEYGRAIGGTINVVTKSGGNQFSGTLDARYRDEGLSESGDHFDPDARPFKNFNPAATLGGPILRDRLWFFGSVERPDTARTNPQVYAWQPGTRTFKGWNSLGKLTFTPMANHTFQLFVTDNRATINHATDSSSYSPEADAQQIQESTIYNLGYDVILNPKWLANARVGIRQGFLETGPMNGDPTLPSILNASTSTYTQSYSNWQFGNRDRNELIASTTYFLEAAGSHTFKAGLNFDNSEFNVYNNFTGTAFGQQFCTAQWGFAPNSTCGARLVTRNTAAGKDQPYYVEIWSVIPEHGVTADYRAFYAQDEWRPIPALTARLGLRWEESSFEEPGRDDLPSLSKLQPRVGLAWDVFNNASTIVHGFWGQVMDDNALTLANFGSTAGSSIRTRIFYTAATGRYDRFIDTLGSSAPNVYDPNLEPTVSDELTLGFTQRLWRNTSLDITGLWRETNNMFEDTCIDDHCDYYVLTNTPAGQSDALRSEYQGVIAKLEARPYSWLSGLVSYTWAESKGSVEYTQNQGSDFDQYPYHFINTFGYLSDDARHRVKASGYARAPWGTTLGVDFLYRSGVPDNITIASSAASAYYGNVFAIQRGERRVPNLHQLDLQLMHEFSFGPTRFALLGTVYNALNSETVTDLGGAVGGYTECATVNADPMTVRGTDANRCIPNPLFGSVSGVAPGVLVAPTSLINQAVAWQTPRRYEVGIRFEF